MDNFNREQQLCRKDINLLGLDKAMMIEIRWSKTIQYKQKVLRVPVLPAKNKAICPVFWVYYMIARIPVAPDQRALALSSRKEVLALSANQLIYRFRKWLLLIGMDASLLSLHSIRRGYNICIPVQHGGGND